MKEENCALVQKKKRRHLSTFFQGRKMKFRDFFVLVSRGSQKRSYYESQFRNQLSHSGGKLSLNSMDPY